MEHLNRLTMFVAVPLLFSLLISPDPGFAQPSAAQSTRAQIDDRELRAFVRTYVETQNIRREYEPPLAKTSDPDKARKLHAGANQELKDALARNNLTVEQYNRIFAQVNNDSQLRQKVLNMVDEQRQKNKARAR